MTNEPGDNEKLINLCKGLIVLCITRTIMNNPGHYYIDGTEKCPEIDFNLLNGELILNGKSIPENAAKVYEPLLNEVKKYIKSPRKVTNFRLNLQYFNSASLIWFTRIIKTLSTIDKADYILFIHIYFEIEDFDSMDTDEIKDLVSSFTDNIGKVKISIGIKIYGTDDNHHILKESTILT